MPDNFFDSIVTDSPYGLKFMNKHWDYDVPKVEVWQECFRVLKPGGHLLSFFGTRTYHRGVVRIEDAGFETRDMISWIYGSGLPKNMDIGKQVDKIQSNKREIIKERKIHDIRNNNYVGKKGYIKHCISKGYSEFEGWGTALKPACEPICLAQKPVSEKNIALNALKYGTGGLNIEDSRIPLNGEKPPSGSAKRVYVQNLFTEEKKYGDNKETPETGRFPANVILDEESGKLLDMQSGPTGQNVKITGNEPCFEVQGNIYGNYAGYGKASVPKDNPGGASRFFYCAKASKNERNAGLGIKLNDTLLKKNSRPCDWEKADWGKVNSNNHPTVKPIKLMMYLVKLVTPKNGIVLDPFAGSGTTGIAAAVQGCNYVLIEREKEYCDISKARIEYWAFNKEMLF